ncbi:hypothetical protein D5S17_27590 [Pseudonocardiaceae bacterium YIM PH 21723]|nr:hypothetical protein D5S17_27590 [Pseudonocardiaceae bacterium YIM PH 21723]
MLKKVGFVAASAAGLAALLAPTAMADNDSNFQGPVNAADNWNFSAAVVCLQEVAIVPALAGTPGYVGDHDNNCSNGNVIDHS